MSTQKYFLELIEIHVKELEFPAEPKSLYNPAKFMMSLGGKRIRPLLTLMSYELFHQDVTKALPAALAIEVFHNFTLMHDDIMDNAEVRRGKPTVYKQWGMPTAILSGDVMLIKAYELLLKSSSTKTTEAFKLFNRTAALVCEGQQLDMDFESRNDIAAEDYLSMIRAKTAVLLGCAAQMGGLMAEASETEQQKLYEFGTQLGITFQLQDDYLDTFSTTEQFGKTIGGDILAGKKTYLLLKAMEHLNTEGKAKLQALISDSTLAPDDKIEEVKKLFIEAGVKELTQEKMNDSFELSMKSLNELEVSEELKKPLRELGEMLLVRAY